MDEQVKDLWTDALVSGRFKRGKFRLHRVSPKGKHTYCCLGVLCELYNETHPDDQLQTSVFYTDVTYDGQTTMPPKAVRDWAGLGWKDENTFARLNDGGSGRGRSFREIASFIRKNY